MASSNYETAAPYPVGQIQLTASPPASWSPRVAYSAPRHRICRSSRRRAQPLPCRPDQDRRGDAGEPVAQGGADGAGWVQDLEAAAAGLVLAILLLIGAVRL